MSTHERHLCDACIKKEYDEFRHACVHESMDKNEGWLKKYRINSWPRWDYSMDDATLTFSEEGKARVICDIEVVGSVQGESWEWSWGNANFPMTCKQRMETVRAFGEEKQWERLTTLFLENDEYVGWECASVTNHLLSGIGAYRCPSSETSGYVYVVILASRFVN